MQNIPAAEIYNLACVFSLCSQRAPKDETVEPAQRESLAAAYADRAVELLAGKRFDDFGRANVKQLKADADFRALDDHPGFQRLVKKWTQRQSSKPPPEGQLLKPWFKASGER